MRKVRISLKTAILTSIATMAMVVPAFASGNPW